MASSLVATGYWLGITAGRIILGFVTPLMGERLAITIYLPIAIAAQLLFGLIPSLPASAVFVAIEGFFIGPTFPAGIVVAIELLPKHLPATAIGFATALGGCGAASLPLIVGVVAQAWNATALQPIVLFMLVYLLVIWLLFPPSRRPRRIREEPMQLSDSRLRTQLRSHEVGIGINEADAYAEYWARRKF